MQTKIPYLTYSAPRLSNNDCGSIIANGQVIHTIDDMGKFYEAMGFTPDMKRQGLLADEFIWEEYVKDSSPNLSACYQKHIIEYLLKNSPSFKEVYGQQLTEWIAIHANTRTSNRSFCNKCRLLQYCSIPNP